MIEGMLGALLYSVVFVFLVRLCFGLFDLLRGLPHHRTSDPTVMRDDGLPNGLPFWVRKQIIEPGNDKNKLRASSMTDNERMMEQARMGEYEIYLRQGGGNGTRK